MGLFSKGEEYTYIVEVEGMRCGMCETHVNDIVRRNFDVKKVKSSHVKNETVIISKKPLDKEAIKKAISKTGYGVGEIREE